MFGSLEKLGARLNHGSQIFSGVDSRSMDYDRRIPLGVIDALTLIYSNDSRTDSIMCSRLI